MGLKHKDFVVKTITDTEQRILDEKLSRRSLYIYNRGEHDVYLGNSESFSTSTNSLILRKGESITWETDNILSNAIFAKCLSGLSAVIDMEEV